MDLDLKPRIWIWIQSFLNAVDLDLDLNVLERVDLDLDLKVRLDLDLKLPGFALCSGFYSNSTNDGIKSLYGTTSKFDRSSPSLQCKR